MEYIITKLEEEHLPLVDAFSCIETEEELSKYTSKERRRIKKHSKEMDDFLKFEALDEQKKNFNTTHLFINEETKKIIAYISLCSDSIKIENVGDPSIKTKYKVIPAVKIARLAVSNEYQHLGYGQQLIKFAVYLGSIIRKSCGFVFLTLDCYKHRTTFYEKYGFVKNTNNFTEKSNKPISMRLNVDKYLGKL